MKSMNAPSKRIGNTRKITAIKENKKGQMVVSFGAEKLALSPNAFTEMPLYVGKELTSEEYRSLTLFLKNESLWKYALSLVSKGSYSTHDIREKMRKKSTEEDTIRRLIFSLKQQGLVNDEEFAEEYKEEKENQCYGKNRIIQDLKFKHGIRDEIVDALAFKSEEAHAQKLAEQWEKKYARLPLRSKKEKAALALVRRGYDEGVAREAVSSYKEAKDVSGKNLKILCEKTLKKYGAKYNGYSLRSKTFAYLLSKGYAPEEVERALEECL
jgi:SOS response regulatory protein OraA/RecX